MRLISPKIKKGFTLVELVVVTPLIVVLIGAVVAVTIQASNSALRSQARSQLQNDVLLALDMMEQDIRLSRHIVRTTTTQLQLHNFATTTNPSDPDRQLIRQSNCATAKTGITPADATVFLRSYVISGASLIMTTNFNGRWCGGSQTTQGNRAWQNHDPTVGAPIIKDASLTLTVTHDPVAPGLTNSTGATVRLTARRTVAGQQVEYTGTLYAKSSNILQQ